MTTKSLFQQISVFKDDEEKLKVLIKEFDEQVDEKDNLINKCPSGSKEERKLLNERFKAAQASSFASSYLLFFQE